MSIEQSELRRLLGHFATGVAVVTAVTPDGEKAGVTINSFNSVSMSPELVLFSLDCALRSLPVFQASEHFCVNFLSAGQEEVSRRFAARGQEKWSQTRWRPCGNGAPMIDGALAHIECERHTIIEGGDHLIFLCRVRGFASDATAAPLIYFRGGYHELPGHAPVPSATPIN